MKVRKSEVLRYLGHKNQKIDDTLMDFIDSCIQEIQEISKPHYIYREYAINRSHREGLLLGNSLLLRGEAIAKHLKGCSKCFLLGATLGPDVDRQIRTYELTDMTRAVILDTCASEAIEGVCDEAQEEIETIAQKRGYHITSRFSPGYGDLPIELQSKILSYLDAPSKIGLTSTASSLLIPRKSVTAIIGCSKEERKRHKKSCRDCNAYEYCTYKKEEEGYGCTKGE